MDFLAPYIPLAVIIAAWIAAAFFFGRRLKKLKQNVVVDSQRPKGHLTLIRKVDATNVARMFKVLVDGDITGRIAAGETTHIELSTGKHEVAVQVDWCKTDPVSVDIDGSRNTALVCGSTYNDWKCMFMFVVDPKNYLYVSPTS